MNQYPQYPDGTDLLWMAYYIDPETGEEVGATKHSGTIEEAAAEAIRLAEEDGTLLWSIRRRY